VLGGFRQSAEIRKPLDKLSIYGWAKTNIDPAPMQFALLDPNGGRGTESGAWSSWGLWETL